MTKIYNDAAYEAAKWARIKNNARITRSREWKATVPDHERIDQFLNAYGEFSPLCAHCKARWDEHLINTSNDPEHDAIYGAAYAVPTDKCRQVAHPVISSAWFGTGGEIAEKMRDALMNWGSLTPKQADLVRSMISRAEARVAAREQDRAAKLAADQAGSRHLGKVGERMNFNLTVERILSFETQFGYTYINLCRSEGSVVVYKGSNRLVEADDELPAQVAVKATVKAHDYRDGVAQTLISRPKAI